MHEYSLVRALLRQVDALRREQKAERVVSICVSAGEFSGVEPELFRDAYELLIEETPMQGAELQMTCVPLKSRCDCCGQDFAVARFRFECPTCNSRNVTIVSGEGLVLESVTVEQDETLGRTSNPSESV